MQFPELTEGILVKRYKRFLADVRLANGEMLTVHCPNSGSMKGCNLPGAPCWISDSNNPKRKLRYTLEAVCGPGGWIGVHTGRPNGVVKQALEQGLIPLEGGTITGIRPEVRYGREKSRIDLLVEQSDGRTFLEVKGVSLAENGLGLFPDARTTRGEKHLRELQGVLDDGDRAALVFCLQRSDARAVAAEDRIDPSYAVALHAARSAGVQVFALHNEIDRDGIVSTGLIPVLHHREDFGEPQAS